MKNNERCNKWEFNSLDADDADLSDSASCHIIAKAKPQPKHLPEDTVYYKYTS